uniref:Alpha/beta hydrolase fold-3 domain-containing protein n=1 Tax=Gopherus agassizii TaxID=38772 RepID=A0A452HRT2_9SAUR
MQFRRADQKQTGSQVRAERHRVWEPERGEGAACLLHHGAASVCGLSSVSLTGTRRAQATMQTLLHRSWENGERGTFPLVLYIHGGYWQFLSKEVSGFIAPPLVTQGIAMAAVGYDVAPKGHMDVMVAQVRRSVAFIVQQYSKTSGVYLCGHSAGAHLAAMVLSTDWEEYGVTPDIKGAFLVSGVYDLEPITHTSVNNLLHVSREVARRNSPVLCMTAATPARKACEVLIAVAQHDSPEFHRQSREYFQALRSAGWSVSLLDIADTDHFDVIEKLSQRGYILTQVRG